MRYQRIHAQIWSDEKFRKLSEDAKFLFLYLMTSPHSNSIGIYVLPKQYIECDLGWSGKRLAIPFAELLKVGFILYDETERVVCIRNHIKHNPIQNQKQVISAEKIIESLPKSPIFSNILERLTKQYHKPLVKLLTKPYTIPKPQEEEEEEEKETEEAVFDSPSETASKSAGIPFSEIQKAFNEHLPELPEFKHLTAKRKKAIAARWFTDNDTATLEWWRERFFPLIARSDFLTGRNGKSGSWACSIDWILKTENFVKIREGTYNNRR